MIEGERDRRSDIQRFIENREDAEVNRGRQTNRDQGTQRERERVERG